MKLRFTAIVLLLLAGTPSVADKDADSVNRSVILLTKALSYDRNLRDRAGSDIVIAVVEAPGPATDDPRPQLVHRRLLALEGVTIQGAQIRAVLLEGATVESIQRGLDQHHVDVLILASHHLDAELEAVAATAEARHILTASIVPDHVRRALTLGVDTEGPKIRLLINRTAAKREGAKFSGELLQIAEVIQ